MKELEKTERKQRNHDKTGKLAKKREQRRLDAIERQVRRIQTLEENLKTAKKKGEAQARLSHAELTLQQIRGGHPHESLAKSFGVKPFPTTNKEK